MAEKTYIKVKIASLPSCGTGSHKTGEIRKVSGYLKVYEMGFSRDDAIDYLYSIDNRRRIQGWRDIKVNIYI